MIREALEANEADEADGLERDLLTRLRTRLSRRD
jgi:hypothetical protein